LTAVSDERAPHDPEPHLAAAAVSQQELVVDHLWLADALAGRYRARGVELEDLRQVARCGLVEAAGRYDPAMGTFAAFAAVSVAGVLKRYFRDHGWSVRPPRGLQQLSIQMSAEWSEVAHMAGHEPTHRDFAASLGQPMSNIEMAQLASRSYQTASLDDDRFPVAESADLDPGFDRCEDRLMIERVLSRLEPLEQRLLRMRFWEERTQSDIAQEMGTSQMQVSRLLKRAVSHLRELLDTPDPTPSLARRRRRRNAQGSIGPAAAAGGAAPVDRPGEDEAA